MKVEASVLRSMAEEILSDIDYDIYKEDMEEDLGLTDGIESKLKVLVEFLGSEVFEEEL